MTVVFPGLSCNMVLVLASIGSEGLLVTEALQSCLHHQIYLRTGQLWADGRSMLHLHQQWQAARASVHLKSSLVLPLPVPICSPSGVQPGRHCLIEPQIALTESYGVLVGHTLVCRRFSAGIGRVSGSLGDCLSRGWSDPLGASGRHRCRLSSFLEKTLRNILHQYAHVFPAPGEPVTGRTTTVQHEIETNDARPVQCGPRRLVPAGQIEPSDSPCYEKGWIYAFLC